MIEQYYAVNDSNGDIFRGAGGCCFDTQDGLTKSIKSMHKYTSHWFSIGMSVSVCPPPEEWTYKKVALT